MFFIQCLKQTEMLTLSEEWGDYCFWLYVSNWAEMLFCLFSGPEVLFQDWRRDEIRGWWWWWNNVFLVMWP